MKENPTRTRMPRPQRPAHPSVPALEWVRDLSGRTARVTAVGSGRVLVENHCGVENFTDECVCLSTAAGRMTLRGSGLALCEVRPTALIVRGCIRLIELPAGGDGQ